MDRQWALPAAAAVLALENVGVLGGLMLLRGAPLAVEVFLLLKFPACLALLRRSHAAFLALTLWESFTLVIALMHPAMTWPPRLALMASSALGLTLLGLSLRLFPTVELPEGER